MTLVIWTILKPFFEILILWAVYYRILVFVEGTRSFQVLKGIVYIIAAFLLSQILGFDTLNWLLTKLFGISIIAIVIIFQQELRHGLARLGQQHLFSMTLAESELAEVIQEITTAAYRMSKGGIGCIIAVERETKLKTYIDSGIELDAKVSAEMLLSIFTPQSPLHDGGVIVRGDRIVAASCLFPLSETYYFSKSVGTRHRAALGLTEQTDAVVVMVSEETSEISVAADGRFMPVESREKLVTILKEQLSVKDKDRDEKMADA